MYSNVNLTALEGALKDAINKKIKKVDYDASIDKYGNSYVADILASVLGVEVERKEFCWQAQVLCDCLTSTLNIGLTQIEITKGKNISTVIGEILAAVSDEYHGKCYEKSYCTFNDEGMTISRSGSEMTTKITEDGMTVYRDNQEVLVADNVGVKATNLHATTYLIIGTNSRFEDYDNGARTGCFWIKN